MTIWKGDVRIILDAKEIQLLQDARELLINIIKSAEDIGPESCVYLSVDDEVDESAFTLVANIQEDASDILDRVEVDYIHG